MEPATRKIIHVDMDAFYASVEQRDRPELRGRPVIVGGAPDSRGVVCTASYEARRFGVRSAMPASQAYRLCPEGVFLPPDFERYRAVSEQVQALFREHTDLVEPLSLDEAYLDVTVNRRGLATATEVARAIRAEVRATTGLTASAGVAPNKLLAKIASDLRKPDGLVVVTPGRVAGLLRDLPVRKLPGVGRVTEARLRERGVETCAELLARREDELIAWFGAGGLQLRDMARGVDHRPVEPDQVRRSVSVEDTFPRDLHARGEALAALGRLTGLLEERLREVGARGRTITVKVKYADFHLVTRSRTHPLPVWRRTDLLSAARELLERTEVGRRPVRLLGVGLSHLDGEQRQLLLPFLEAELPDASPTRA